MTYNRPNHYEYALLSDHVYGSGKLREGQTVPNATDWEVDQVSSGKSDYFGAIYVNHKTKQVVVAHKGTYSLGAVIEDIRGIILNGLSPQKHEAFQLVKTALDLVNNKRARVYGYHLSFTGHSLGAFLAELSVFFCHKSFNYPEASAVTFESPGVRESLMKIDSNLEPHLLDQLNIQGYVSYPNKINACNKHIGTLYSLTPDLGQHGYISGWFLYHAHTMTTIIAHFKKYDQFPELPMMTDWPLGAQADYFFNETMFENGQYKLKPIADKAELTPEELEKLQATEIDRERMIKYQLEQAKTVRERTTQTFKLDYEDHYTKHLSYTNKNSLALRHFPLALQEFLPSFYSLLLDLQKIPGRFEKLCTIWNEKGIPDDVSACLLGGFAVVKSSTGIARVHVSENLPYYISTFSEKICKWLEEKPQSIIELLQLGVDDAADDRIKIIAEVIAPGAEIFGTVKDNEVVALKLNLPADADATVMAKAKEMLEHAKTFIKGITTYIVAPGVKVHETAVISGNKATGYEVNLVPSVLPNPPQQSLLPQPSGSS